MFELDYLCGQMLSMEDSSDIVLANILENNGSVMGDGLEEQLLLMDIVAIKKAGGEFMVHWLTSSHYH